MGVCSSCGERGRLPEDLGARRLEHPHLAAAALLEAARGIHQGEGGEAVDPGREHRVLPGARHRADPAEVVELVGCRPARRGRRARRASVSRSTSWTTSPSGSGPPRSSVRTRPCTSTPLGEEAFDEVAAVLAGGPGDERDAHRPVEARSRARSLSTIISTSSWKRDRRLPAEPVAGLARVADEQVDLGGPHEARVLLDVPRPVVDADRAEGDVEQLADRVRLAGGQHVVVGLGLLQHPPHALDVVAREAPVALGVEVAHGDPVLQAERDRGDGHRDLAGDELRSAARRLVVEQDAGAGVHAVGLAVVDRHVVAVDLGHAVGRARPQEGASRAAAPPAPCRTSPRTTPGRSAPSPGRGPAYSRTASSALSTPLPVTSVVTWAFSHE